MQSHTCSASGGSPPYHYDLIEGLLPEQITAETAGNALTLAGTATAQMGKYETTWRITDSENASASFLWIWS